MPAVAVKLAVVLPDPTVTDAGTVNEAALLERITAAPLAFDTVTVQVEAAAEPRLVGLHASPLTTVDVDNVIAVVCVLPFSVAVMVADWSLTIVPAVAVKVPAVLPAPTVTDPGTVNSAELLDSATVPPAGLDSVTVQIVVPPDANPVGLQTNPLGTTGASSEMVAVSWLPFSVAVTAAG